MVHRFNDLRDLDQTLSGQMSTSLDRLHTLSELLKVFLLRGPHPMSLKERDDRFNEIDASIYDELAQMLAMVVVAPVQEDPAHPEDFLELFEASPARKPASRRTCETPDNRSCSPSGSFSKVAERNRWKSILLRPQNREPSQAESAFPADCPHSSRCHYGKRPVGRHHE